MNIEVKDIVIYENLPFDQYKALPGNSFSGIKLEGKTLEPTAKMNLGSEVDNYLNQPGDFNGDIRLVKPIANAIKSRVGNLYFKFRKQVSITATFTYQDMCFQWKGRLDWGLENIIVVDIKVAEDINKTIHFFDYPNQIVGYCLGFKCTQGLILAVNPKNLQTQLKAIRMNYYWWEQQILKFGQPLWKINQ